MENPIPKVLSVPALVPKAPPMTKTANGNGGDDASRMLTPRADHRAAAAAAAAIDLTGDDHDHYNHEFTFKDSSAKNGRQAEKTNLRRDGGDDDGGSDASRYRRTTARRARRRWRRGHPTRGRRMYCWASPVATGGRIGRTRTATRRRGGGERSGPGGRSPPPRRCPSFTRGRG